MPLLNMNDPEPPPEPFYATIHCDCFFPAKLGPSAASIEERKQHTFQAFRRSTESIKVGVDRGDVDDILEYGIRLMTGARARKDPKRALQFLLSIAEGPYPREIRAIAYSVASQATERYARRELYDQATADLFPDLSYEPIEDDYASLRKAGEFAEHAARLGLFSWASVTFAYMWDGGPLGTKRTRTPKYGGFKQFWDAYAKFRLETGTQRPNPGRCSKCNHKPYMKSLLKACGGPCSHAKKTKPLYCSRACQVSDWPYHKKFCNATWGIDFSGFQGIGRALADGD